MKRYRQLVKQNSGFSLIELLIAIAIISLLTVPLLNSFVTSGRVTRNSRALQDATTIAQSVMESAKRISNEDLTEFYDALGNISGVSARTMVSAPTDAVWKCNVQAEGTEGEPFRLEIVLTPKTDYIYKDTNFADIYSEANVVYSELTVYDNSVITAIKNTEIPYDGTTAIEKWVDNGLGSGSWVAINSATAPDSIKHTWKTYDNLLADECSGAIAGLSVPTGGFTNMNALLIRDNIEKQQSITFSVDSLGLAPYYKAAMDTEYTYPIQGITPAKYSIVCAGVDDADPAVITYYRFSGIIKYEAPDLIWSFSDVDPIYLLYSKGYTDSGLYNTFFGKTQCAINFDSSVTLGTDESGALIPAELCLVEQAAPAVPVSRDVFEYTLTNNSAIGLNFYTTEAFSITDTTNNTIQLTAGNIINYSNNSDSTVAYRKLDPITAVYNVAIHVYYDKEHNDSYSEMIYSVTTEDN